MLKEINQKYKLGKITRREATESVSSMMKILFDMSESFEESVI